jgi:hypothetical protein
MNKTHGEKVVRLDEMDERDARMFLTELLSNLSPEEEYNVRHEDYVMEMPQSGERIRGRERMREFQESYSSNATPPVGLRVRRVLVRDGLWIVEGNIGYDDGQVFDVVLILELRDGKMWHDRWYFAKSFEAPKWRARWFERMQTGA